MALSDYVRLEYIESTGTQYIDTLVNPVTNKTYIEIKITSTLPAAGGVFGVDTNDSTYFGSIHGSSHNMEFYIYNWNYSSYMVSDNSNSHPNQIIKYNSSGRYITDFDGNIYAQKTNNIGAFSIPKNMTIFEWNNSATWSGKVYYCKIWDDQTLIRDLIPARNIKTNAVGMYDLVNNVFYTNMGTGEFIAGPVIYTGSPLKINLLEIQQSLNTELDNLHNIFGDYLNSYTRLEYIQSTGTQYIDTLYKHQLNKTRIVADIDIQQNQVGNWCNPFGSWGNVQSSRVLYGIEFPTTNANADAYCYYGRDGTNWNYKNISGRKIFDWNKNMYKIGSNTYTFTLSSLASAYNFYIFNCCSYTNKPNTNGGCLKLYSFKIYDNDVLVRDYIPVRRNSDGAVCLYDNVSSQYFLNAGTGTFIAGGEL